MPIEPKRIEAAARAIDPWKFQLLPGHSDEECLDCKRGRDVVRDAARRALAAGFPGLASDPPTAWVAPLEMPDDESGWDDWMHAAWEAARDAHTKEQT